MPTVHLYLYCCAVIAIASGSALSLQASPHGYNASYKSILTPSGAFPGYKNPSPSSKMSPTARTERNLTFANDTLVNHASSSSACCFVVQDTIDVRFWADYLTHTTVLPSPLVSHITFATQYIDTLVTTNVSTVIRLVNQTSTVVAAYGMPTIPGQIIDEPGPLLKAISLNGSLTTAFGATITSPTQFYVFTSVNVIYVSAISDTDGLPACATTSTYRATCSTYAQPQRALYITGINSNAESYFNSSEDQRSAALKKPDMVPISFSEPFVYVPLSDPFPSRVVNENFGYVPQTLIEWMAQDSGYASKFPGIASCLPGGPSIDFHQICGNTSSLSQKIYPTPLAVVGLGAPELRESHLTLSTTVTIAGKGCFHPGGCPTPATPGASAVTATATVTSEAERLPKAGASSPAQPEKTSSPVGPQAPLPSQAPDQPLLAPVPIPGTTPIISTDHQAANSPPNRLLDLPTPIPKYSISIAPSASAVIVNGITSILPATGPGKPLGEENIPITQVKQSRQERHRLIYKAPKCLSRLLGVQSSSPVARLH
ncbi:hypothetical protein BDR22DRAFT_518639 [Usnea florida]